MNKERYMQVCREEDYPKKDAIGLLKSLNGEPPENEEAWRAALHAAHPLMVSVNTLTGDPIGATDWD